MKLIFESSAVGEVDGFYLFNKAWNYATLLGKPKRGEISWWFELVIAENGWGQMDL